MKLGEAAGEISSGLLALTHDGCSTNFMVVSCGDIYVQFAGSPGNPRVLCESIANEYLTDAQQISAEAVQKLAGFGFLLGGDEILNFSRTYQVSTEVEARELATLAVRILEEVYGVSPSGDLKIEVSLE